MLDVSATGKAYQKRSLKINRDDLPQLASPKCKIMHLYSDILFWWKEQPHAELCEMFNLRTAYFLRCLIMRTRITWESSNDLIQSHYTRSNFAALKLIVHHSWLIFATVIPLLKGLHILLVLHQVT